MVVNLLVEKKEALSIMFSRFEIPALDEVFCRLYMENVEFPDFTDAPLTQLPVVLKTREQSIEWIEFLIADCNAEFLQSPSPSSLPDRNILLQIIDYIYF